MQYNFQANHDPVYTEAYLRGVIPKMFPESQTVSKIGNAIEMAKSFHAGQLRGDGSDYIVHPLRVALLLLENERSVTSDIVIAAIFHDALEDTELTEEQLRLNFGDIVTKLTIGVTRYRSPKGETAEQRKEGKLNKWKKIMESGKDIRLIKCCDYLDNMICWKFIKSDSPAFQKIPRWLMEVEKMYLPLAKTTSLRVLGMMEDEVNYYNNNGFRKGNWYTDSLLERLEKRGDFYIDGDFDRQKIGPKEIAISEKSYYRFMDFFYMPKKTYELTLPEVVELCELRLKYMSKVVDYTLNTDIVRHMTTYLENHIPNNSFQHLEVLDFGCGSGLSSSLIQQSMKQISLRGVDISEQSIELATQSICNAKHISIGEPIPFVDDFFDFSFAVFVMHFNIGDFYLKEISRVLKNDGVFIFNTYNRDLSSYSESLLHHCFRSVEEIDDNLPGSHTIIACIK